MAVVVAIDPHRHKRRLDRHALIVRARTDEARTAAANRGIAEAGSGGWLAPVPVGGPDRATKNEADRAARDGRGNAEFEDRSPRSRRVHMQANDQPNERSSAACQQHSD